jgi:class 3 adenylate cyclase/tetratricopeptide (TPR) repeat protein
MPRCAACGQDNPDGFRFCGRCGAAVAPETAPRDVRKVVTVLFCDVVGSTELGDRTDPETLRRRMRDYYEQLRTVLERHGGTVEKFVGDAVMAVFGVPQAHEDDALRAVRAAAEMQAVVAALGLDVRIGINTGEVVAGEGDTLVTGDAVNVAARLEQSAGSGEILIGAGTRGLVRDAVQAEPLALEVKGKADTVVAFRLVAVDPDAPGFARRLDTPLVGRTRELLLLREAYERAVTERGCHLFTLLGPAGVGKSRLVAELLAGLDARVIRGRCLHYGQGITFWPVVEALLQLGQESETVVARIEAGGTTAQDLFWEVRKLIERVAAEQSLVVVFDDLHWAEPTFLDLIDHIADLSRGAPILLLCVARPELLDDRPGWAGGKLNATTVLLEPLSAEESAQLIGNLAGDGLDDATRVRIVESSEGNPLFVEEMLALVREDGDVSVPPTIHALLAARLDRLASGERAVVERGAVEGKLFHAGAVRELAPDRLRPDVGAHLVSLVRKELIRPETAQLPGEDAFRFRHLLIRDAAYEALPKETRAELHELFAGWLEEHGASLVELDEIAGWHLEQAVRYRRELGATTKETAELAARAAARLVPAGQRAADRGDLPAARSLLARAVELASGTRRRELLLDLADVLTHQGAFAEAADILHSLSAADDERIAAHARVMTMLVRLHDDPNTAMPTAREAGEEAIAFFEPIGDHLGLARTWCALSYYHWTLAQAVEAGMAAARLLDSARLAGKSNLVDVALHLQMAATCHGPAPCGEMEKILSEVEQAPESGRSARAVATNFRGMVARLEGRFADGRDQCLRSERELRDLGFLAFAAGFSMDRAEVELAGGDPAEAERILRDGIDELEQLGEKGWLSTCLATLARAVVEQGRLDEADEIARRALETGATHDVATVCLAYGAMADAHLGRGEIDAALQAAEQGVAAAAQSDFAVFFADSLLVRSRSERGAGRTDDARASIERAVELYDSKEASFPATHARALLAEL